MDQPVDPAAFVLHPAAALVPEMPAAQYPAFKEDVRTRGVRTAIEYLPGTTIVLDGRTRLRAARECDAEAAARGEVWPFPVPFVQARLAPGESPLAYMLRAAVLRRSLTSGQRAMIAVTLEAEFAREAKERQRAAGGDRTAAVPTQVSEPSPPETREARYQAARQVGVGTTYVSAAKRLVEDAPDLAARVQSGEMAFSVARRQARGDQPPAVHKIGRGDMMAQIQRLKNALQAVRGCCSSGELAGPRLIAEVVKVCDSVLNDVPSVG